LLAVGINPERISIKPNFVKETSFSWCSVDARQDKRPYALFVGRLSPEKALLDLLRAWVLVRHIPLRVAGTGPELNYARQLVRELNLEVEFLGYLSRKEVLEQMANARCVVVSDGCYEAGIPLVVIESWAVGAPVVAPRTGSMGSLVDRVDSVIFNDFSGNTFHQAISAVWTDTELRQRVSVGGRDRWQRDHSPEVSLASLISIYQSLRSVS
jgi:glycosyltransferase involved in cell wall biosynthesis